MSIKLSSYGAHVAVAVLCIVLGVPLPSMAAPPACNDPGASLLADMSAVKPQLDLSANQAALWQKAEDGMRAATQKMEKRRAQHIPSQEMTDAEQNPRAFAARMDREMNAAIEQMKQVREQWFAVHDALDAQQRAKMKTLMRARMELGRAEFQKRMANQPGGKGCGPGLPPMGMMPPFPF